MNKALLNPLSLKLSKFFKLTEHEKSVLSGLTQRRLTIPAGGEFMQRGRADQTTFVLSRGWVISYWLKSDGSRQIVDFRMPGDLLGLRSVFLKMSDHFVEPITDIEVTELLNNELLEAVEKAPRLATAILWALFRDEAIMIEHLVNVGRRGALERTAHLMLELGVQMQQIGLGEIDGYTCPLTQYHLADALGLTAIHVNRVLRHLREEGLLTFRSGEVVITDYDRLVALAGFDDSYLIPRPPLLA